MVVTDCDGCGGQTLVNSDAFNHPKCVLVLCSDCAMAEPDKGPYPFDENHHVVGTRVN